MTIEALAPTPPSTRVRTPVETRSARPEPPAPRLLTRRGLQKVLGALWLLDALLQLEPPNFARDYPLGDLAQSVMGAPGWENRAIFSGLTPFAAHWPWWNLASALLQGTIGLALVAGVGIRAAQTASRVWSAAIWF